MPPDRLRIISNGIFFSLLSYGLQVYGSVSGLVRYADDPGRYQALSRDCSHQIQVIMNIVLRALTNLEQEIPVWLLLKRSGFLLFHQMCAHSILKTTHKILTTKEPSELYLEISETEPAINRPRRHESTEVKHKLSISRESFNYQAVKLFYSLPQNVRRIETPEEFKKQSRMWVSSNISIYM